MEYGLARRVLDTLAFVSFTESEFQEIKLAREGLRECLFMEEKFDLLIENYFELETTLFEIAARNMVRHQQDYRSIHLERNLIDRRIVNLLWLGEPISTTQNNMCTESSLEKRVRNSTLKLSSLSNTTPASAIAAWRRYVITCNIEDFLSTISRLNVNGLSVKTGG